MNRLLILSFIALFTCKASAQKQANLRRVNTPPPPIVKIEDASKYIGKKVTVHGHFYSYKKIDSKQRRLIVIGEAPYYSIQILIEGNDIKLNPFKLKGAHMVFRGIVSLVNQAPTIVIRKPSQIGYSSD